MANKQIIKTISKWLCLLIGSVLLILVSWYSVSRLTSQQYTTTVYEIPGSTKISSATEFGQFSIGCYNIAHGRGSVKGAANRQARKKTELVSHLEAITQQLREAKVDILVLNEIDFSAAWSFHLNQAEFLAKHAEYPYVAEQRNFDVSFPFFRFRFGNAILSRYPIHDVQFIDFPPYSWGEDLFAGNHDALFALIDTSFGPLGILAVHLEYRSEAIRVQCVRHIIEWYQSLPYPIIVAGDFNSTPDGFPGAQHTDSGLNAMTLLFQEGRFVSPIQHSPNVQHFTFPSEQPATIIDWVLGKGAISIIESKIIPSRLSDHFMVTTIVQMTGVKK